jgi:hypothetical protein
MSKISMIKITHPFQEQDIMRYLMVEERNQEFGQDKSLVRELVGFYVVS